MHKNTFIFFFLFLSFLTGFCQEVDIIDGLDHPLGIAIHGDYLFICEHSTGPSSGIISKIDLTETNPTKTDLLTNLFYPRTIALVGDQLYYAAYQLSKFNINDTSPTPTPVLNVGLPKSLLLVGDYLYVAGDNNIRKLNIYDPNPTYTLVLDNLEAQSLSLAINGDELYFAYSNKVSKFNVTDSNPTEQEVVSGLEGNVYSLAFYDNILFIGMAIIQKIVTLDINTSVPQLEPFLTTTSGQPTNFLVFNDDLYIAGGLGNTIFKIEDLPSVLSVDGYEPKIAIKVYPNPTSDVVQVLGLKDLNDYQLINSNGRTVLNGVLNDGEPLDISSLSSGVYYLKLKATSLKEQMFKVIKK